MRWIESDMTLKIPPLSISLRAIRGRLPINSSSMDTRNRPTGLPAGGRETVLLGEDEPMVLKMGLNVLEALGYRVLPALSPVLAVKLAEEGERK